MKNLIASLPALERARLYRRMATETRRLAEQALVPDAKASFEMLSASWTSLAEDVLNNFEEPDERHLAFAAN